MSAAQSETKQVAKEYRLRGWTVTKTRKGHWRFTPPTGTRSVFHSGSPSDWRSWRNFLAELRRVEREIASQPPVLCYT